MDGSTHYIVLKLRVKQVTHESKIIMTTARDHKNLCILLENSAGESTAGVTYLSMRTHPKSCHISPLKVSATLLNGLRKGTVGA